MWQSMFSAQPVLYNQSFHTGLLNTIQLLCRFLFLSHPLSFSRQQNKLTALFIWVLYYFSPLAFTLAGSARPPSSLPPHLFFTLCLSPSFPLALSLWRACTHTHTHTHMLFFITSTHSLSSLERNQTQEGKECVLGYVKPPGVERVAQSFQ